MTLITTDLTGKAERYLDTLCRRIENRRVGTAGNQAATRFLAQQFTAFGWAVDCPPFDCLDWSEQGAELTCAGQAFAVQVSPYSLGCAVQADLVSTGSLAELEAVDARGKLLLVHGELTREQLMPKNFPFYNPDEHKELIRMLEGSQPAALICATGRNPALAGGMYPFPLFEDGDFDIPSVYITDVEGERLAQQVGKVFTPKAARPARWMTAAALSPCCCWQNCCAAMLGGWELNWWPSTARITTPRQGRSSMCV